jgi:hypothetical protein
MVIIGLLKTQGDFIMLGKRNTTFLKTVAILVCLAFTIVGFAANAYSARIIPTGKVFIIKDGEVVSEFTQEAPLPEGYLLRCEGKCAVKLDDVYMVVEPNTVFSVDSTATGHSLTVLEGTVFYSMTEDSRPITFNTPAGDARTSDISLSDSELSGYVRVVENKSEVGVIRGGVMTLETKSGDLVVGSGENITMTSKEPEKVVAAPIETGKGGMSKRTQYTLGAVGAGIVILGGIALGAGGGGGGSSGGGGGGDGGSPAAP